MYFTDIGFAIERGFYVPTQDLVKTKAERRKRRTRITPAHQKRVNREARLANKKEDDRGRSQAARKPRLAV